MRDDHGLERHGIRSVVGGGFVIVPALTRYSDLGMQSIVATSQAGIALVSLSSIAAAAGRGDMDWNIALPFAAGATLALMLGRRFAARMVGARLQRTSPA